MSTLRVGLASSLGDNTAVAAGLAGVLGAALLFGALALATVPGERASYATHFEPGVYACASCDAVLFTSADKFRSTTRWPSFRRAVAGAVATRPDLSYGLSRVEALCARCGAHLGHVFPDGRLAGDDHPEADERFCVLSSALDFQPQSTCSPQLRGVGSTIWRVRTRSRHPRRSMDTLRFIRETMERATPFTAVSGWGEIGIGVTALAAAPIAALQTTEAGWLGVWVAEAALAVALAGTAMVWKARRAGVQWISGAGRKFALSFAPPMFVGALLTAVFLRAGLAGALPGLWLATYGTAVMAGGTFSVPIVVWMGVAFLAAGTAALFGPAAWGDYFMAAGFGGLHIAFGAVIARRHGG